MKFIRSIAILLLSVMLFALPVYSASPDGMSFKADEIYRANKIYAENPNTFEAWIKLDPSVTDRGGVIIGNWSGGNPCVNFEVSNNGIPRLYIVEANGTVYDYKFTNLHVNTGEWVHLAIVRDAAKSKSYCYIDGELKQTLSIAYTYPIESIAALQIGGDYRGGNVQYFKGSIKSIALWDDVRTATEIQTDMNSVSGSGLIAAYDLTAFEGLVIEDLSSNGYDVSLVKTWIDPDDKAPVSNYAYSIAVVGDTQRIAYNYKSDFGKIYKWILDNAVEKNTKFVIGLGDITETSSAEEWEAAMGAITQLDGKIPYSLVRGNHDSVNSFNTYVSVNKYGDIVAGYYGTDLRNSYQLLDVGEVKYLIMTLDYGASNQVLSWAGNVIDNNSDRQVIITTHAYLFRDGTTLDAGDVCPPATTGGYNNGDHIWDKLISKHENIVLVLSGHDPCDNVVATQTKGEKGNVVTQMLIDPQAADNTHGGVGAVAMLYFSEDGKELTVEYYSTFKDKYFMSESQFSMRLDVVDDENDSVVDSDNNGNNNNNDSNENNNDSGNDNGQESGQQSPILGTDINRETDSSDTSIVGGADDPEEEDDSTVGCLSSASVLAVGLTVFALGACLVRKKED